MGARCTGEVRNPVAPASAETRPCLDDEVSSYSFTWPSLRRGQALNSLRDPLEHDFTRLPDVRPWVGAGGRCGRARSVVVLGRHEVRLRGRGPTQG